MNDTDTTKIRKYDAINVSPETKLKVDEVYYRFKVKKKFKTFDDFINWLLDSVK